MDLSEFSGSALSMGSDSERIQLFGWWLHSYGARETFTQRDLRECYQKLHLPIPTSFSAYVSRLAGKKVLLKNKTGYRLSAQARVEFNNMYGEAPSTKVQITAALEALPARLPTLNETQYLDEALRCYKAEAPRAAMVMTWNLAFAHLCDHILKNRLADFNARWLVSMPGMHSKKTKVIAVSDDFNKHLKEQEVLDVARDADIIKKNVFGCLEIGLKRRNMAAHPNDVQFNQLQVDAYIDDLVNNAILKIV